MSAAILPAVWILAGVALTALVADTNRAELVDLHTAVVASYGQTVAGVWFALAGLWSVLSWPLLVAELAREDARVHRRTAERIRTAETSQMEMA